MNDINDIADYVIFKIKSEDTNASLINLKLQKLLYYIQAWSYGIHGKPFFNGAFEAWIHGPVNRTIYERFSKDKTLYSEIDLKDIKNKNISISPKDSEFVEFILENYARYSGAELERLSHME